MLAEISADVSSVLLEHRRVSVRNTKDLIWCEHFGSWRYSRFQVITSNNLRWPHSRTH